MRRLWHGWKLVRTMTMPQGNGWVLYATTLLAIITAIAAIVKDRRKPDLDAAAIESTVINSAKVKAEIKSRAQQENFRRDLRILDLEEWGEQVRPYLSQVAERDNQMLTLIREDRVRCKLPMPDIAPLPPPPPFPKPQPLLQ